MSLIYLDHAATSWPKPPEVTQAVVQSLGSAGNPGRSGHKLSLDAGRSIHKTRHQLGILLNAPNSLQIVFALNSTDALNMAIKGLVKPGTHVITTCFEHNSVYRPLYSLQKRGLIELTVLNSPDGLHVYPEQFRQAIRANTDLIVVNHASNVTGAILDLKAVSAICREQGIKLVVDGSQTIGVLPLDVQALDIACLACSGHKGLLGPQGTGILYVRPGIELEFWREGGTGSVSHELFQPEFMPDRLEAGTPNTPGIAGLGAGVEYVTQRGLTNIRQHELMLTERLRQGLGEIPGLTVYGPGGPESVGVVSISLDGWDGSDLSVELEQSFGILTRPGLHCAPLAHQAIGTYPGGTVRLSVGYCTTVEEIEAAVHALQELSRK